MRVNGILLLVSISVVCSADWRSISKSKKLRIRNAFLTCDECEMNTTNYYCNYEILWVSSVKNSIPYSQLLLRLLLCSEDSLRFFLKIRGSVRFLRQTWLSCFYCSSAQQIDRESALQTSFNL